MAPLGRPPVMLDIVEEHFEELDFLWELREGVIFAPDWNLDELAELEERAEAHLDGLRLAELHAVDVVRPHLMGKEKFAATAATFVMMETGEAELIDEVVKAFVEAKPEVRDGIRIGLRHSKIDAVEKKLFELVAPVHPPTVRAMAADVLSFHGRAAPDVRALVDDEDESVVKLALAALGRGLAPLPPAMLAAVLQAKSNALRRSALEAAARSSTPGLMETCTEAASRRVEPDPEALAFLGVLGARQSLPLLQNALARPELANAALRGLGALGLPGTVPVLLAAMSSPDTAETAALAFERITGVPVNLAEPPENGPDVAAEFADGGVAPDIERARAAWRGPTRAAKDVRIQAGREIESIAALKKETSVSLESRRDLLLGERSALSGFELERRVRLQRSQ